MRIMFDDDLGQRIVMECSTVAAVPDDDSDKWLVVASEIFDGLDAIIRADLTEGEAKRIVAKIFDVGAYVTSWTDLGQ